MPLHFLGVKNPLPPGNVTESLYPVSFLTGLQNNGVWMFKEEMKEMWLDGAKILLKPSYTGSYGEDKK